MGEQFPDTVPTQLTTFIGREAELAELVQRLTQARLVTLTGAGGMGKTRLALELVARSFQSMPGGVWFVDLAPLSDPELIPYAMAAATRTQIGSGESPLDANIRALRAKRGLLVLDNCERLVASTALIASRLLREC